MRKKTHFIYAILSLISVAAIAQPANDDPCGAADISVNNDGYYCPVPNSYSTLDATNTSSPAAPSCSSNTGDVWFKFVATSTAHRITRSNQAPITGTFVNPGIAAYSSTGGDCTTLSELACTTSPTINLTGLTVGSTYYIRVWTAGYTGDPAFTFDLCVGTAPAVPVNNECANAIDIGDAASHGAYTDNATQSKPSYDCGWGASPDAMDVWYKFIADATGTVTVTATMYTGQPYVNIERFTTCASATPVDCDDDEVFDGDPLQLSVSATSGSTYYFRMYGNDGLGYMSIQASGTPLPVHFISFDAAMENQLAVLNWSTGTEVNNKGFDIERSTDGSNFSKIGFMPSEAESEHYSGALYYNYTDAAPLEGKSYYRLAQVDLDGKKSWSEIVSLDNGTPSAVALEIFPNPSSGIFHVKTDNKSNGRIKVTDATGRIVTVFDINDGYAELDMQQEPPGIYFVHYNSNGNQTIQKLLKIK